MEPDSQKNNRQDDLLAFLGVELI